MSCYGFVYIWYDRFRKMFYIGSHKGSPDDGYICSNKIMINAIKKRPQDFRRKILKFCNKEDLLLTEQKYLDMIRDDELYYKNKKYYNIKRFASGGDTTANLPNREEIIKRRYGKKHSNAVKNAIKNRSKEKEELHQQRRKQSLRKTLSDPNYKNYQDKPFDVIVDGQFYKRYRNKMQFAKENCCDLCTFAKRLKTGSWVIKHKRKHPFRPGQILTFKYVEGN